MSLKTRDPALTTWISTAITREPGGVSLPSVNDVSKTSCTITLSKVPGFSPLMVASPVSPSC